MLLLKKQSSFLIAELNGKDANRKLTSYPNLLFDFKEVPNDFTYSEHLELSKTVDMLVRFGLLIKNDRIIQFNYDCSNFKKHCFYRAVEKILEAGSTLKIYSYRVELTILGGDFVKSCVLDDTGE